MATPADLVASTAQEKGIDPYLAVATAIQESGLNPQAVGDNGTSFGLFQLHKGGELGDMTSQEAFNPGINADTALSVFQQVQSNTGLRGGALAAAAQRPANPTQYASAVDDIYNQLTAIHTQNTNYTIDDVVNSYFQNKGQSVPQDQNAQNPVQSGFGAGLQMLFGQNNIFTPNSTFSHGLQNFMTNVFLPGAWTRVLSGLLGIVVIFFGIYFIAKSSLKAKEMDS